ncbi:MAG: DUF1036 domain-containing protein [Brevundimonas sp.]|uniref:DUF1036 domain-containing protein n=1 Tax=Brevundimonas sp. TaxID=1871086 RepID=UPI002726A8D4|nr:DUF1036 domain-containing protein [Brevundimonas sp.]MDO9588363.1 DUF1036 domain-containing protein [Brevundimonas sp.]MDP3368928.1 DUF1036 domain-containing protein [Brevundimonas sp.]MDP3655486.1 DUF1036 domain-containing protein [Brevundimonas sp.]MDZ4061023.1 DUF1036 domain-containing protein [Brevundimonas sp.]
MRTRHLVAVLAMGFAAGAPGLAPAQSKPGMAPSTPVRPDTVDIRVCNESGRNGTVAISYVEVGTGRFMNRGWYVVNNGACTELVSTDNANFYMYGDTLDGSGRTWSGNHALCVQYPGPYTFWSDGSDTCPSGYEIRNFVVMRADEVGPYTWTLEP